MYLLWVVWNLVLAPLPSGSAVGEGPSRGVNPKQHQAAPTQDNELITGSGACQNHLVVWAYRESFMFTSSYRQKCQHIEIVVEYNKINWLQKQINFHSFTFRVIWNNTFFFSLFLLHAAITLQVFSVYSVIAMCIHSHFTVTENNRKFQFVRHSSSRKQNSLVSSLTAWEKVKCNKSLQIWCLYSHICIPIKCNLINFA